MRSSALDIFVNLKPKLGHKESMDLLNYIEENSEAVINRKKDIFLVKDDKIDIMRSIYLAGVVQYLAILGSMLAIFSFLK